MGHVNLPSRIFRRQSAPQEDAPAPAAQTPAGPEQGANVANASGPEPEQRPEHVCPHCKAPMADGQEWCTQCGERSGGSLRKHATWASAGVLTAASAILASGAAAAGVAALTQGSAKESPHQSLLAQTPVTTTAVTPATPPPAVSPGSPETLKAPHTTVAPTVAPTTTTTHTSTPSVPASHGGTATGTGTGTSTGAGTAESRQTTSSSSSAAPETPELQGLTASAYTLNPQYQKTSLEGPENDPMRALEGPESGTSWTVQIVPGTASNVNVGLLIALGGPTRVGSVEMHTSAPGFPVEIYGTTSEKPPTTITAWKRLALTPALKPSMTVKLGSTGSHWRYVLLWIPKVSASTHRVAFGEVALYPPAG